jgi:hypothetical protein
MKVLECSSAGDKRFSALYAAVTLWNKTYTIEEWYQFSKVFGTRRPNTWQEAKQFGKFMKPTECVINHTPLDISFLTPWYKLLWLIYLDQNALLVDYASQFDEFHDKFKGRSMNCQADVIRQYIKNGRLSIIAECNELLMILKMEA